MSFFSGGCLEVLARAGGPGVTSGLSSCRGHSHTGIYTDARRDNGLAYGIVLHGDPGTSPGTGTDTDTVMYYPEAPVVAAKRTAE